MLYPVIVHKDADSAYGVILPDFPGCFTAGDTLEEALTNAQEAVELHFEGERDAVAPAPSPIDAVLGSEDARDGAVLLVNIDLSFLDTTSVPVNITMPVHIRNTIDRAAKARGMSRSAFMVESALRAAGPGKAAGA
ncbi:type II toxin-antitoxin system HicB family antitoxin [Desulfovibrio sp. DS-1]|nr:type II toxin-antitoxin system HicB family antitoxin [Nitratidesulfovibrio sp. SRB-5]RXF77084.1 type II toxin-antitoxin system HicB family antitoxin [Desulfovibrio sp. DS-1]